MENKIINIIIFCFICTLYGCNGATNKSDELKDTTLSFCGIEIGKDTSNIDSIIKSNPNTIDANSDIAKTVSHAIGLGFNIESGCDFYYGPSTKEFYTKVIASNKEIDIRASVYSVKGIVNRISLEVPYDESNYMRLVNLYTEKYGDDYVEFHNMKEFIKEKNTEAQTSFYEPEGCIWKFKNGLRIIIYAYNHSQYCSDAMSMSSDLLESYMDDNSIGIIYEDSKDFYDAMHKKVQNSLKNKKKNKEDEEKRIGNIKANQDI